MSKLQSFPYLSIAQQLEIETQPPPCTARRNQIADSSQLLTSTSFKHLKIFRPTRRNTNPVTNNKILVTPKNATLSSALVATIPSKQLAAYSVTNTTLVTPTDAAISTSSATSYPFDDIHQPSLSAYANPPLLPTTTFTHLKVSRPSQTSLHWDNACSYNLMNSACLFSHLYPLSTPEPVGGIGGSCLATHAGYLTCLPSTNYMNLALYCPTAPLSLLSIGQLHSCGGHFNSTSNPDAVALYADAHTLLDIAPRTPYVNLYSTNSTKLIKELANNHHLCITPTQQPLLHQFSSKLLRFVIDHPPKPFVHQLHSFCSTSSAVQPSPPLTTPTSISTNSTNLCKRRDCTTTTDQNINVITNC